MKNIAAKPKKSRLETLFQMYAHRLPKDGEYACTWNEAIKLDPSKTHRHLHWILNLIVNKKLKAEDRYKVPGAIQELRRCHSMLRRDRLSRDLNSYGSLPELASALAPYARELNPTEIEELERAAIDAETEVILKTDDLVIVSPKTQRASCFWGRGTQWCTAATSADNAFHRHTNEEGEGLFILIDRKEKGQKYQFSMAGEARDAQDQHIGIEELEQLWSRIPKTHPALMAAFIANHPQYLAQVDQNEEICLRALHTNGRSLRWIKNPTQTHYLAAVRQNGRALQFVVDQTPSLCQEAIKQDPSAVEFVKNRAHLQSLGREAQSNPKTKQAATNRQRTRGSYF